MDYSNLDKAVFLIRLAINLRQGKAKGLILINGQWR